MIRTLAVMDDGRLRTDLAIDQLSDSQIRWYWVDFASPNEEECSLLQDAFTFHPLAVEDCFQLLQRPKLDYYDGYNFFVLHAINPDTLEANELDLFVGNRFVLSFHYSHLAEIDEAWHRVHQDEPLQKNGPVALTHFITNKLVDQYFPLVYQIDDQLSQLNHYSKDRSIRYLIDQIFTIRSDLLKLRRIIGSMGDLLYRILNSQRLHGFAEYHLYFTDIYDHLLKLAEMIESSREITADMRDSYLSHNSYRMNTIMITLTIVSSIFIPLTFIAGIYGMNFSFMPELETRYGYFIVLGIMLLLAVGMVFWIKRQGWLDVYK